ncbi:nedd8-activating enzyme E1 catalytic subunit [Metopolophium dirhodum]|uniref:nedd8-activating enzyme E1 catalytic subunit n=1 Tax=Metopolophium dirhodum TaxID=44670 RepID=UPI00298FEEB0|nr:nedd8-activating enzyme E1 catalytic subunit [Metopolophium dirhodum]
MCDNDHRRWSHLKKILERSSPFCHPDFEPGTGILEFLQNSCKLLVVGAGGLGCELLKDLAMMGFGDVHVIDMDTIDLSNLNRQFLFRRKDVNSSKAEVAAKFINERVPTCRVTPHHCKIQDKSEDFYRNFHFVVCGLDSVVARRWINGMLISLLSYDDNQQLDNSTVIPLIDGGTEGFKGNVRVIIPGITPCIDCTLDLFPPQVTYPLCTIASTPRLPEHCIEYVKLIQWPKENPFDSNIDTDDPVHISWIYEKSLERADEFGINGVNYRLVQGVIKNIIPAVASTNAVIAAACVTEAFKVATSCCPLLNNYAVFNDADGIYTYTYEAERKSDCITCSPYKAKYLDIDDTNMRLEKIIEILGEHQQYQMKNPALTIELDGKRKTLYMPNVPSIELKTRPNLKMTLEQLGIADGCKLLVADITNPRAFEIILKIKNNCVSME